MMPPDTTVDGFLASLIGVGAWVTQCDQIIQWALAGRQDFLLALSAALMDETRAADTDRGVRVSVLDTIENGLAVVPRLSSAEASLGLALAREVQGGEVAHPPLGWHQSNIAALLAHVQPTDVLSSLFERHGGETRHHELLACLVQEMALRSIPVVGAAAAFWEEEVVQTEHRLGWLPTVLLPQEKAFPERLPRNGHRGGHGQGEDSAGRVVQAVSMSPSATGDITWTEVEVPQAEKRRAEAAVDKWATKSNGSIESRFFHSDSYVLAKDITPAALLSLPLESLEGVAKGDLRLAPCSAVAALAVLFGAASNGGVYYSGHGGAYGRLEAWRSASALVGAMEVESPQIVAGLASGCAWFRFPAESGRSYGGFWDFGLAILRPDGRTLAVLTATDTD